MSKAIKITLSGVGNNIQHDGQLSCKYVYASSKASGPESFAERSITKQGDELSYTEVFTTYRDEEPIYFRYVEDPTYDLEPDYGLYTLVKGGNKFSIYKREYQIYQRTYCDSYGQVRNEEQAYVGEWTPVAVRITTSLLRDYNITAGRSYQYIIYPNSDNLQQQYANLVDESDTAHYADFGSTGLPVATHWNEWSLTELVPVENSVDTPIVRKTYQADPNNVWLFKYSLETGAQNQTFSKNEMQTLGRFPKFGYGRNNYVSGDVSCLLGSEIVPYSSTGYVERMRKGIKTPLSANEKVYMLRQWRNIAFSPNPKLLKDIKGQSWIVQITSSSNTPQNFYPGQPDTISFSWKQIDSLENVVIIGPGSSSPAPGQLTSLWKKKQ